MHFFPELLWQRWCRDGLGKSGKWNSCYLHDHIICLAYLLCTWWEISNPEPFPWMGMFLSLFNVYGLICKAVQENCKLERLNELFISWKWLNWGSVKVKVIFVFIQGIFILLMCGSELLFFVLEMALTRPELSFDPQ